MQWFWDQYTADEKQRAEITASPLRASLEELAGLPPAMVIVGEADVLRACSGLAFCTWRDCGGPGRPDSGRLTGGSWRTSSRPARSARTWR